MNPEHLNQIHRHPEIYNTSPSYLMQINLLSPLSKIIDENISPHIQNEIYDGIEWEVHTNTHAVSGVLRHSLDGSEFDLS